MRRAQFSLEFLLTYGWILLLAFLGLAVVYSTGIISVADFLPDSCEFTGQIRCVEAQVKSSATGTASFNISLANGFGTNLVIYNATLRDSNGVTCVGTSVNNTQWPIDSRIVINVSSCTGAHLDNGLRFAGNVVVTFYRNSSWCTPNPSNCLYDAVGYLATKIR